MNRFYGKYRGTVTTVDDQRKIGRVKLRVPAVYGNDESDWAYPYDRFTWMPIIGDKVWVEFIEGDPNKPIYGGRWIPAPSGNSELQPDAKAGFPNVRVFDSPDGAKIVFDAQNNVLKIVHANGSTILQFDNQGNISMVTNKDIEMTAQGDVKITAPVAGKEIQIGDGAALFPLVVAGSPLTPCLFFGTPHINNAAPQKVKATP